MYGVRALCIRAPLLSCPCRSMISLQRIAQKHSCPLPRHRVYDTTNLERYGLPVYPVIIYNSRPIRAFEKLFKGIAHLTAFHLMVGPGRGGARRHISTPDLWTASLEDCIVKRLWHTPAAPILVPFSQGRSKRRRSVWNFL